MALSPQQISWFRSDIGDSAGAFSEVEINDLYDRAFAVTPNGAYERAIVGGIDQLLANAAKRASYRQNETQENAKEVFDNLMKLRAVWAAKAGDLETKAQTTGLKIGRIRRVPASNRDFPRS